MIENVGVSIRCRSKLKRYGVTAALLLGIPLVLTFVRGDWVYTNIYMPPWFDPFIYQAIFHHPAASITNHQEYYPSTRLPWILWGAFFYWLFSPLIANLLLKMSVYLLTTTVLFAALVQVGTWSTALLSVVIFATYPYFIMSAGWDFVDSPANAFIALTYLGLALAARPKTHVVGHFLAGFGFASAVICNLYAVVLGPSLLIFAIAAAFQSGRLKPSFGVRALSSVFLGVLVCFLSFSIASWGLGGSIYLLASQFHQAAGLILDKTGPNAGFRGEAWNRFIPNATWLALPTSTAIACIFCAFWALGSIKEVVSKPKHIFVVLVSVHFLLVYLLFWLIDILSVAVLALWFYSGFLNVSTILTIGCLLQYCFERPARWFGKSAENVWLFAVVVMAFVLVVPYYPPIGLYVQRVLGIQFGSVTLLLAGSLTSAGLGITFLAAKIRSRSALIVGSVVLSLGYLSMLNQYQLSNTYARNRRPGFLAVEAAVTDIESKSDDPNRYVWVERKDPDYGGNIFHAIWIRSLMSSKDWDIGFDGSTSFPAIPLHGFISNQSVIIVTKDMNWEMEADAALDGIGFRLQVRGVDQIAYDDIDFKVISAVIQRE